MLTSLLFGVALAADLAADESELPPAPTTRPAPPVRGSALWIGVTPPVVGMPLLTSAPLAFTMDVDLRFPSEAAWIQPELRVAALKDFAVADGVLLPGTDTRVLATFGARFGTDTGVYGGLLGGISGTWTQAAERGNLELGPAVSAYGGYAFRVGERVRISPELTLGTMNTLAVRVEWGG